MIRLAQVFAGILVATAGVGSSGVVLGRPGPQAAGKPANPPAGQVPESWIGKKAVIKYSAPLIDGDRVVTVKEFRVYTVNRVDGGQVKLVADGVIGSRLSFTTGPFALVVRRTDGVSGWVNAEDIILLGQAIDFYTKEIQGDERDWPRVFGAPWSGNTWAIGPRRSPTSRKPSASGPPTPLFTRSGHDARQMIQELTRRSRTSRRPSG